MEATDKELIIRYKEDGDEEALALLVERYTTPLYNLLVRLMGDKHEAEDLTQETFMKIWKGLPRFDTERLFKTWAFAIARNTAIDYLRKKKPTAFSHLSVDEDGATFEENIEDELPLQDELLIQKGETAELEAALKTLSLSERTVIILHHSDDLTFEEIADVVKEPMNTIKSRYRRALGKLKVAMHQNG